MTLAHITALDFGPVLAAIVAGALSGLLVTLYMVGSRWR